MAGEQKIAGEFDSDSIEGIVAGISGSVKESLDAQVKVAAGITAMLTGTMNSNTRETLVEAEEQAWRDVQHTLASAFRNQHNNAKRFRR